MLVVSDTSPITSLLQIGREALLKDLFGTVCVPPAVHDELKRFHEVLPAFLERREIVDRTPIQELQEQLDLGEAEAIVLAVESHADLLLIDERRGRSEATHRGVRVIGLVGVLLLAKESSLIASVKQCLKELESKAGFYLSESLVQKVLEAAGE